MQDYGDANHSHPGPYTNIVVQSHKYTDYNCHISKYKIETHKRYDVPKPDTVKSLIKSYGLQDINKGRTICFDYMILIIKLPEAATSVKPCIMSPH
jgi:hypothetical protein